MNDNRYCQNIAAYSILNTLKVTIGNTPLGGGSPIRIQSMTNTPTSDIEATIEQCIRIANAGTDYVRITVPSVKDTAYLKQIKDGLLKKGYHFPLIADIHFNPQVAEIAATIVEKVRINPGNYADTKKFQKIEYTGAEYQNELDKIRKKFVHLINICKKHKTAIRIGTNHGSLSDRIISRYGDTPAGMAESAMEFLRICVEESFYHVVLSMKASNTIIMVQATRLLVHKMMKEKIIFPLHLGVTEAGEGEDGRTKSAVGIGTLLADGIGDTIRVSLTEDPEKEIPVARKLAEHFSHQNQPKPLKQISSYPVNPFEFSRRKSRKVINIGGGQVPVVICSLTRHEIHRGGFEKTGWNFNLIENRWTFSDQPADLIYLDEFENGLNIPEEKGVILNFSAWKSLKNHQGNIYPLMSLAEYQGISKSVNMLHFILLSYKELTPALIERLNNDKSAALICDDDFHNQRLLVVELMNNNCDIPVIFRRTYSEPEPEDFQLKSAADLGGLFIDGLGDGIWITNNVDIGMNKINQAAFGILQATRSRISKTEFIACPSCGRTNFNIIDTFARIREKTSHLKSLKIGIMGCIVNGLGEMADADYGYVGAGKGKINLYKAKKIIKKNVQEENAVDELINVIKEFGDWFDPD